MDSKGSKKCLKLENTNQIVSDPNSVTINHINDDCLIHIFELLTIKEKLRIEIVCQRWNTVSKLSWSKIKNVEIFPNKDFRSYFKDNYYMDRDRIHQYQCIVTDFYINVLKRSSAYLSKLSIRLESCLEINEFLKELPKYVYNLTHLYIIVNKNNNFMTNECLGNLFKNSTKLCSISLENFTAIDGRCFLNLKRPDMIKELLLNNSEIFCSYKFLSNLKVLNKIHIYDYRYNLTDKMIDALLKSECNDIFEITLHKFAHSTSSSEKTIENFSTFIKRQKKLRKLRLVRIKIDRKIMNSLPFEYLEELELKLLSDQSQKMLLENLHLLKNLKSFKDELHKITADYLENLTKSINKNIKIIEIYFYAAFIVEKPENSFHRLQNLESFSFTYREYREEENQDKDKLLFYVLEDLRDCTNLKYLTLQKYNQYCDEDKFADALNAVKSLPNFVNAILKPFKTLSR